jgi:membrane protease YdiL (CAAX protease family)
MPDAVKMPDAVNVEEADTVNVGEPSAVNAAASAAEGFGPRATRVLASGVGPVLLVAALAGVQILTMKHLSKTNEVLLNLAVLLVVYSLHARFIERRVAVELSLRRLPELVYGALLGTGLIAAVMLVLTLVGVYHLHGLVTTPVDLPGAAITVLTAATLEELIFRGYFFRWLSRWNVWGAIGVTSLFFGLAHLANPHASLLAAVAIAVEAGVLLGAAYWLSGNLWFPIGMHMGWNYAEGPLFNVPISGTAVHGLVRGSFSGSPLLTGGEFGIEASLVALAICGAVGFAMLWLCVRRHAIPVRA